MSDRTRRSTDALALIAFCGFLFLLGLQIVGLVGADEPRYAQVAREMLARHDWVTPVLYGHPWLEKPPLYYWLRDDLLQGGRRCKRHRSASAHGGAFHADGFFHLRMVATLSAGHAT